MVDRLDRVLTTKGYAIKKSSLTTDAIIKLRKELTVSPVTNAKYATATTTFPIYLESVARFYIPRMYGRERFGVEEANLVPEGLPLPATLSFKGIPYEYQETIIETFVEKESNGLICVPCGKGKTFMALSIACRLGVRFMIVVDKEFLLNQWKKEIETFIDGNPRVGVIQGSLCQTDPKKYDITICMIQTICSREFPENTFTGFGFTIFDECHHLGAAYFSRTLMKIQTAKQLGLSATPVRDDGLTKVFEWYLGAPVYWEKTREPDATVTVRKIKFSTEDPEYNKEQVDYKGDLVTARMLTQLTECKERNELIVKVLRELVKDPNRKVLVLSDRIKHLEALEVLLENDESKISYYIGGMKEGVREKGAQEAQILLASYSMSSEAMNIIGLNAEVLATPRKKVAQSTGRILRKQIKDRIVDPLIVDIVDSHGIYVRQWRTRRQYYNQCGYKIECDKDKSDDVTVSMNCLVLED